MFRLRKDLMSKKIGGSCILSSAFPHHNIYVGTYTYVSLIDCGISKGLTWNIVVGN